MLRIEYLQFVTESVRVKVKMNLPKVVYFRDFRKHSLLNSLAHNGYSLFELRSVVLERFIKTHCEEAESDCALLAQPLSASSV